MSRRKKDTKYWIVLICVIAVFALLIGSLGGVGSFVSNLKDTLGNGTEDTSDTSTNNGTGTTDTSGGNVTEPSDTSKPSTDSALYYLGAGGAVKVITEAITSTEGYVLFAFDNVHDANTKWYTTWSIDERFTSNTCCTFIPFDYGGVTLYDVDECLDYTSGSSANEFDTVCSGGDDSFYKHQAQFTGVMPGDTYALRMFKYTLSNGKTTVDVIAEIVQYIEYLNFSNFGFTQINNSGYIDYSGSPVTPETPETESLYTVSFLGYIPTDGLTVRYQTIENGEIVERTVTVNTITDIYVVGKTNIYITFPVEGILSERVSGAEEISYTSTEAVYRVSDKIAYVYFKYVSSEPSEPETPPDDGGGSSSGGEEDVSSLDLLEFTIYDNMVETDMTVTYTTVRDGKKVEVTDNVGSEITILVVESTTVCVDSSCYSSYDNFCPRLYDGCEIVRNSEYYYFSVAENDAYVSFDVASFVDLTITNNIGGKFDVTYAVVEDGLFVIRQEEFTSSTVTLDVVLGTPVVIDYTSIVEDDPSNSIGLTDLNGVTVSISYPSSSRLDDVYNAHSSVCIDYIENDT